MTFLNQTEQIAACIGFILMWAVHLWYSLSYLRLLHEQKRQIDDNILNLAYSDLYKAFEVLKCDVKEYVLKHGSK